ncbi:MAG: alanine racemase [Rhodospirillaceae bacterium]|nr:alanine racemase [Rhodospirillaceae bacterium]|tara:strand:- start:219 stop:1343 length:1125 start_codon:yes stop_codon:yes gene_type:complete
MVLPTETRGANLLIDLDAIAANYRLLQREAEGAEVAAVVKADAYGMGMAEVAPVLSDAGCRTFFTATSEEGIALRDLLPDAGIHVFNGPMPGLVEDMIRHQVTPVLNSIDQAELWAEQIARFRDPDQATPLADLHIDTGMCRLGLALEEVDAFAENSALANIVKLDVALSHLACAHDPAHEMNAFQQAAFNTKAQNLSAKRKSLAASAGLFLGTQYHFDLVRPGIAIYGGNPQPGHPNKMTQVIKIQGRILQVRHVDTPQTVGYGATYRVEGPAQIATVAFGYADGYLRSFSNSGRAWIGGHEVQVAGRVSMDLTTLDVTGVPPRFIFPGALVDFIGPEQSITQMAEDAGTIDYEILTRLGSRFGRHYSKGAPS